METTSEILQLGAVAIIFAFAIKEFFSYLKSKRNGETATNPVLIELQKMNGNHLHSIQSAIEQGNERLIDVIHQDNTKMIELLGEIKGNLNK